MTNIDFNNIDDEMVYKLFEVDGKEGEALNDMYLELFELIGKDAMLKLHRFYKRLASINEFLLEDEEVIETFEPFGVGSRDFAVFTDKRMIWVDVQGISGNKIGYISLPYSKVSTFAVRTAGLLDLDCEFAVAFSGVIASFYDKGTNGRYVFNCPASSDIKKVCKVISKYILK